MRLLSRAQYVVLLLFIFGLQANAQEPVLVFEDGKVVVKNIDSETLYTFNRYFNDHEDWQSVFPVTATSNTGERIPIKGEYQVFENRVEFAPRFPFAKNLTYRATFFLDELTGNRNELYLERTGLQMLTLDFTISPQGNSPSLQAIYPSSDTLPENLLKFHLRFSKSMSSGEAYSKIHLHDESGNIIEKAFLIVDQELWDEDMKMLTVILDPGRIKRGLRPNLEMKPALTAGKHFQLRIDAGWTDIDGLKTEKFVTKKFVCSPADRQALSNERLLLASPSDKNSPLILSFKEPINFASLMNSIKVFDNFNNELPGENRAMDNERSIEFMPNHGWTTGEYTIRLNTLCEDLAGNNFNRPFDKDLLQFVNENKSTPQLTFRFSEKPR